MVRARVGRSRAAGAALALLLIVATACTSAPSSPTTIPAFSQTDLRVGTGAEAASGQVIQVNYTGWLYDASKADHKGGQFDSSIGKTPFSFTLGTGQVIKGWDTGVAGMKVGGQRRLVIPPSLGYGATRSGPIPPNATLLFDIELLSIQ